MKIHLAAERLLLRPRSLLDPLPLTCPFSLQHRPTSHLRLQHHRSSQSRNYASETSPLTRISEAIASKSPAQTETSLDGSRRPNAELQAQSLFQNMAPSNKSDKEMNQAYKDLQRQQRKGAISAGMKMPLTSLRNIDDRLAMSTTRREPAQKRLIRTRPMVGRTVELNPARGMDLAAGMRALGQLVSTNRVRSMVMQQRAHERPGLKRKRLKRERWRKLFKNGFYATLQRVREMRAQGW